MPEKDTVGIGPYETLCKKMLKSLVRNPFRDFLSHRRASSGQTIGPTEAQEIWEKIFLAMAWTLGPTQNAAVYLYDGSFGERARMMKLSDKERSFEGTF
jgi:hypothetical protein